MLVAPTLPSPVKIDRDVLRRLLFRIITGSPLMGCIPSDGHAVGVDGSPGSWAGYLVRIAEIESELETTAGGDVGKFGARAGEAGSIGLFQLSPDDGPNYGLNGGRQFTRAQLEDPEINARAAVAIHASLLSVRGGLGRYWSAARKLAEKEKKS